MVKQETVYETVNNYQRIVQYLRENSTHALAIWEWTRDKPDKWEFRQKDILDTFKISKYKYDKEIKVLRSLGLMKTIAIRNPINGTVESSRILFFTEQHPFSMKCEISKQPFINVSRYINPDEICEIAPNSPDVRKSNFLDSPYTTNSNDIAEMREAIPQSECGDSPIEQRIAFTDQFEGNMIWQTFDDSDKHRGKMARVMNGDLWDVQDRLEAMNKSGAGVFVAVNEMKGNKRANAETKRVRFLVADFDGVDPRPAFKDKPHMIVESSPGKFHCYWRITDCPPDAYRQLQKSIIRKHGSDPAVCDLARVLRVPGFNHNKGEPFMTKLWYVGNHMPLTFAEAVELFPPEPVKKFSAPRYQTENSGDFRGAYGTSEGGRNNWLARRIGGMIKAGRDWATIESEAMKEAMACSPPLPEKEAAAVLRSMRRYA